MQPKKYDSFQPKRAANVDGFFSKPGADRPRQPVFKQPSAKLQPKGAKLADMPRRPAPQAVLTSASQATATPALDMPLPGGRVRGRGTSRGAADPTKQKHKRKWHWKKIAKRTGLALGVLVLLAGAAFGFRFYKNISQLTGNNNPLSLLGAFVPANLDNEEGRVNVLVAGNSADNVGHSGGSLTDSIMVLSVNTRNNTALMLSIPRDMWVTIPGEGHAKINSAYTVGGMDTLEQVVEDTMGVPIHYQALVNYSAFRDLVNAVGGISVTIKNDDKRGIYDPSLDYTSRYCCALAKYPNGPVNLDGKQALNLARARGDAYGSYGFAAADFTRTQHQRDMLLAIKVKASSPSVIANPLKVSNLVDAVGQNVTTDLELNEIQTLYSFMKKVDNANIDSYNVNTLGGPGTTLLASYASPNGQSALIPAEGLDDFSVIQAAIKKLFSNDQIVREAAGVVVLNGTDTLGLARVQGNKLTAKGVAVLEQGNAAATQPTTTIVDNSEGKKPNTLAYLKKTYKATVVKDAGLTATYPDAEFIVILGTSAAPAPTATP
jgi:LCP family protein required for cell wall assembly